MRTLLRLQEHVQVVTTRFLQQLVDEEMFNKVKRSVQTSVNTTCSPQRAMAVAIDQGVTSKVNHYIEVDRSTAVPARRFQFDAHTFYPILKQKFQDEGTKAAAWNTVVGHGDSDWYSPTATTASAPYCDIAAKRSLTNMKDLQYTWLSRLCSGAPLLIRRVNTPHWYISMGNICSIIVKCWPSQPHGKYFVPLAENSTSSTTLTVTDAG